MERKFKVGDKVRFIGNASTICFKPERLDDARNNLIIDVICDDGFIGITPVERSAEWRIRWFVRPGDLELINFTKADLQPGDMVTLRSGDKLILNDEDELLDVFGERNNSLAGLGDVGDDLKYHSIWNVDSSNDIMKVERPTYHTVYERVEEKKEPKKMTVAEISKELGYDVEIVKG